MAAGSQAGRRSRRETTATSRRGKYPICPHASRGLVKQEGGEHGFSRVKPASRAKIRRPRGPDMDARAAPN